MGHACPIAGAVVSGPPTRRCTIRTADDVWGGDILAIEKEAEGLLDGLLKGERP